MPTYEYRCKGCGEQLEVVQAFTDDALTVHDACGGELRKVFGSVGISFKGSGFYKTDSRPGSSRANGSGESSSSDASSSSDTSSSSDSSTATDSSTTKDSPTKTDSSSRKKDSKAAAAS